MANYTWDSSKGSGSFTNLSPQAAGVGFWAPASGEPAQVPTKNDNGDIPAAKAAVTVTSTGANALGQLVLGTGNTLLVASGTFTLGSFAPEGAFSVNVNKGTISVADGAQLKLVDLNKFSEGVHGATSNRVLTNYGTIALNSTGARTSIAIVDGLKLTGKGVIALSDSGQNRITGAASTKGAIAQFNNVNNTISGAGRITTSRMSFTNGGTVDASAGKALEIGPHGFYPTGQAATTITNNGLFEATGTGGLLLDGSINNIVGTIAANAGNVTLSGVYDYKPGLGVTIHGGVLTSSLSKAGLLAYQLGYDRIVVDTSATLDGSGGAPVINKAFLDIGDADLELVGKIQNQLGILMEGGTIGFADTGGKTKVAHLVNTGNISGYGVIGDDSGDLILVNKASGVITASDGHLIIDTNNVFTNSGKVVDSAGAQVVIVDQVVPDGLGTFEIDLLGTFHLDQAATVADTEFVGGYARLELDDPEQYIGAIVGFNDTDVVDLSKITYVKGQLELDETIGATSAEVAIYENGQSIGTLDFSGSYTGFKVTEDANGTSDIVIGKAPPCFLAGTRILTARGEVEVEKLLPGDRVLTLGPQGSPLKPVRWIGRTPFDASRHPQPAQVWPIRITAGALGEGVPHRDLLVSPGHAMRLDGVLVQASRLVNGATIIQDTAITRGEYFHVEVVQHDILLSEGAPSESYLDTGNRTLFSHSDGLATLYPDFSPKDWTDTCLPLVQSGPVLTGVRARLQQIALAAGYRVVEDDRLEIVADGCVVAADGLGDQVYRFRLPRPARDVRLASRTWLPGDFEPGNSDTRVLGICVADLQRDGAALALSDPCLGAGWHDVEEEAGASWRWTCGMAQLPAAQAEIVVTLRWPARVWLPPVQDVARVSMT